RRWCTRGGRCGRLGTGLHFRLFLQSSPKIAHLLFLRSGRLKQTIFQDLASAPQVEQRLLQRGNLLGGRRHSRRFHHAQQYVVQRIDVVGDRQNLAQRSRSPVGGCKHRRQRGLQIQLDGVNV